MFSFFRFKKLTFETPEDINKYLFSDSNDVEEKVRNKDFLPAVKKFGAKRFLVHLQDEILAGNTIAEKYNIKLGGTLVLNFIPVKELSGNLVNNKDPRLPEYYGLMKTFVECHRTLANKLETKDSLLNYLTACDLYCFLLKKLGFGSYLQEKFDASIISFSEICVDVSDLLLSRNDLSESNKESILRIKQRSKETLDSFALSNTLEQYLKQYIKDNITNRD